jgi:hypothetical protein
MHVLHLSAVMFAACAADRPRWGIERTESLWSEFVHSPHRRVVVFNHIGHTQRGRMLLNAYVRSQADESVLRDAERSAVAIARTFGDRYGYLPGRIAYLKGDPAKAAALFGHSLKRCDELGWQVEVLRYRYAIGRVTGGPRGAALAEAALEALQHKHGCRDAVRYVSTYFPELVEPTES